MTTEKLRQEENAEKQRYWKEHLDAWQISGLSQVDYCRQHDLSRFRFQYWKRRFEGSVSMPALIEVPFASVMARKPQPALRLLVDDQHQIVVERDFDPVALRQLIGVLDRL
jgi:hypothetical protein